MTLAELSIKRPTFITCLIALMLAVGAYSIKKLGVDLFPDVTFPIVFVSTPYQGAGPAEIETLISKPLEDELSTIQGVKRLSSISQEGVSTMIAEFTLETDVKFAEQQIRDRVSGAKPKLPRDVIEPTIRRLDPSDQPVLILSLSADPKMKPGELYDLANEIVRPKLEQIEQMGLVYVLGGRKRRIHVALDADKLKARETSASFVSQRLNQIGENIPAGNLKEGSTESTVRTLGQFNLLSTIENSIVNFFGGERALRVRDVARVEDALVDEKSRVYVNGDKSLFIYLFKQSGANTIKVVDSTLKRINEFQGLFEKMPEKPSLKVVRDGSMMVRANVTDVQESIYIGIALTIVVVFFFLGNFRSTLITALALPNSLLGAFILMWMSGYTINLMTLLALSLAVGLLIDDAIVVRENIFRHIEMGKSPRDAAIDGTKEVGLAVVATTLTVIAVFGPVAFLKGVVGQFFKQFGFVVCFAMLISLFDALTIAPMLSAYFAGGHQKYKGLLGRMVDSFDRFQSGLERRYGAILKWVLAHPLKTLSMSVAIFFACMATINFVPKTFLPPQDNGEFSVDIDLPPGTNLETMDALSRKIDDVIRANPEVMISALTVGNKDNETNVASFYIRLVDSKKRKMNTSQMKEKLRGQLKEFASANPKVKDYDAVGGGQRPFNLNLIGSDQEQLEMHTMKVLAWLRTHPALKDVDINFRPGKPEVQVELNATEAYRRGLTPATVGNEIRNLIEGVDVAYLRQNDRQYDVRTRLQEDQRNLRDSFSRIYVPNLSGNLVRLSEVARLNDRKGPSKINRQDRSRYIQIQADISPGYGMGDVMKEIDQRLVSGDLKLPEGMRYAYVGQAENFVELAESMVTAILFGILFIFLVLASLYESFVTPFTIMLALPLAFCGSILALAITQESLNVFSNIGVIMLLGVAVKNSILLVDYANQLMATGMERGAAMLKSGVTRLRPILMTSFALIAGTLPIAMGLNEASRQRTSMGVAIIGGLVSSTLLTLVVVPAAFSFVDRFRVWSRAKLNLE